MLLQLQCIVILIIITVHITTMAEDITMEGTTQVDTITTMDADTEVVTTTTVDTDTTMDVVIVRK